MSGHGGGRPSTIDETASATEKAVDGWLRLLAASNEDGVDDLDTVRVGPAETVRANGLTGVRTAFRAPRLRSDRY
jgi:hypothetical protein